jgi:GTPase Era involved in 16S rRNA processing
MTELEAQKKAGEIIAELVFERYREEISDTFDVRFHWCYEGEAANAPIPLWEISAEILVETSAQQKVLEEGLRKLTNAAEEAIKRVVRDSVYLQLSIHVRPEMLETNQHL